MKIELDETTKSFEQKLNNEIFLLSFSRRLIEFTNGIPQTKRLKQELYLLDKKIQELKARIQNIELFIQQGKKLQQSLQTKLEAERSRNKEMAEKILSQLQGIVQP